ncbi:signal peptidase I [uncultured Bilophila sp.]|nr:signal peptidase I [uncultured Bilophila sp.]
MNEELSLLQRLRQNVIWEYAEALLWAVALALILTTFVVQAFKIPSGSMLETLQIGDHLLVNKFIYGLRNPFNDDYLIRGREPQVGDIIVFRYPKDRSLDYIKRIAGVPGDTLEMRNKVLYRNGVAVQEPYTQHSQPLIMIPGRDNWGPITVPEDKFFALGDNRDDSSDSRFWGFLDRKDIRGLAWRIYWSADGLTNIRLNRIGKLVE